MNGRTCAAVTAAVIGTIGALAPAGWASGEEVLIPLESCAASEPDAHGDAEYRNDGREELRFDVDDLSTGRIGQVFTVSVDGQDAGSMEIVQDEDEQDEAEGTLRYRSDEGNPPPFALEGDETVEIEDADGNVIVSSECDGFDSDSGGGSDAGSGSGGGSEGGALGLVDSLLALLGL